MASVRHHAARRSHTTPEQSRVMTTTELMTDLPQQKPRAWLLLAHGAGAPMTSPFMNEIAALLAQRGIAVARFEFSYMAGRRQDGKRRPPPKAERLTSEFETAVKTLAGLPEANDLPLLIGGKSMGGRVATLIADTLFERGSITGAVALGYPFHPPKKPDSLRTSHLEGLRTPLLIIQGERDPFGNRADVEDYTLSPQIRLSWATDGDHDLGPRGGGGSTRKANLAAAAYSIAAFAQSLPPSGK